MRYVREFLLFILPFVARIHPKNWTADRWKYPQLWYCMPRRWVKERVKFYPNGQPALRRAKPRLVIERICEFLTGHEISETEMGYGGGGLVDRNCRWCDRSIQIPKSENVPSEPFKSLMGIMDNDFPTA
jgi:hypothetical protein